MRPFRVPYVRRCSVAARDGHERSVFIVNINGQGVYLADDVMPAIGEPMRLRFRTPDSEQEIDAEGVVAWLNPNQLHRVHSLPPGYGIRFSVLPPGARASVERIVEEYLARNPR